LNFPEFCSQNGIVFNLSLINLSIFLSMQCFILHIIVSEVWNFVTSAVFKSNLVFATFGQLYIDVLDDRTSNSMLQPYD